MQDNMLRLVNALGEQSAIEQGLRQPITTGDKLRTSTTTLLYLLKDARGNGYVLILCLLSVLKCFKT